MRKTSVAIAAAAILALPACEAEPETGVTTDAITEDEGIGAAGLEGEGGLVEGEAGLVGEGPAVEQEGEAALGEGEGIAAEGEEGLIGEGE